jgi:hypothetical protein
MNVILKMQKKETTTQRKITCCHLSSNIRHRGSQKVRIAQEILAKWLDHSNQFLIKIYLARTGSGATTYTTRMFGCSQD